MDLAIVKLAVVSKNILYVPNYLLHTIFQQLTLRKWLNYSLHCFWALGYLLVYWYPLVNYYNRLVKIYNSFVIEHEVRFQQFAWNHFSSAGKQCACIAADPGSIPGAGRSPGEGISYPLQYSWASLVAQMVKNPPAMQENWVWALGWKDPLEKSMATHSSVLAWKISMNRGAWRAACSSWGCKQLRHNWATKHIANIFVTAQSTI